jgi:hypothetical protein
MNGDPACPLPERRTDGASTGLCYSASQTISSFNDYKGIFQAFKSALSLDRFYAVVAANRYSDCYRGGMTWAGKRYMDMASALGGLSVDLCAGGLARVLPDIGSHLVTIVQTIIFNYVKISDVEPEPSSIVIKKNGATIPQSATNGWTYVGQRSGYTSYSPSLGNYQTGYMVRLNGTAEFKGSDTISIDYQKK